MDAGIAFTSEREYRQFIDYIAARNQVNISNLKDRKSTRLNSSHVAISYAVFCLKKKKKKKKKKKMKKQKIHGR